MKKIILLLFLIFGVLINLATQEIVEMEYFFDNDPGVGLCPNNMPIVGDIDEILPIPVPPGLPGGFHTLNFRFRDEDNYWSLSQGRLFYVFKPHEEIAAKLINAMEYFFDNDQGVGLCTGNMPIGGDIDEILPIPVPPGLPGGFHTLNFRFRDEDNYWSLSQGRLFYVFKPHEEIAAKLINAMEYFFDNDQGVGLCTGNMPIGGDIDEILPIPVPPGLPGGFHTLNFRFRDEDNNWSLSQGRLFYVFNPQELISAKPINEIEYFIDTDPGVGNGELLSIPLQDTLKVVIPIEVTGLALGVHNLFIRVKDLDDEWSISQYSTFEVVRGLSLKVFLEGPYIVEDMGHLLNVFDMIPLDQPYNIAPWNYSGTESVTEIPPGVVDWVYLELHDSDAPENTNESTIIEKMAAFLLKDGSVVDLDGSSPLKFTVDVPTNDLYVAVYHRNHLPVLSSVELIEDVTHVYTYDFTTPADQAYGMDAQKDLLSSGIYGMYGGNANPDGTIDLGDKIFWNHEVGASGYKRADMDLNGQVNNADKNWVLYPNWGKVSTIPYLK